jgi:hypothetical protein
MLYLYTYTYIYSLYDLLRDNDPPYLLLGSTPRETFAHHTHVIN